MTKRQGKGVVPNSLAAVLSQMADEAFTKCDAVVIVGVKVSGANDSDEQVIRCSRGPAMLLGRAVDLLYEHDESKVQVWTDDSGDDED
jgi:hypothetical protein